MAEPRTELPIRVYTTPHGDMVACLCDAERAYVTPGPPDRAAPIIRAARGTGRVHRSLVRDLTPLGLVALIAHARKCQRGQNIARGAA